MIGADLIIAAAGGVLAVIVLYMELPVWMVLVVLCIRSSGSAFHSPALSAVTPLLVPQDKLTKCDRYSQTLQSVNYIVSPAAAAFLYFAWQLNAIIALDMAGAVIACITVAFVRIPKLDMNMQSMNGIYGGDEGRLCRVEGKQRALCAAAGGHAVHVCIFADKIGVNRWFLLTGVVIMGIAGLCIIIPVVRNLDKTDGGGI